MCSSTIPSSFYEAKRKFCDLGLGNETIHACKYDFVLYWKEFGDLQHCPTCSEAWYKVNHNRGKKISHKRDGSTLIMNFLILLLIYGSGDNNFYGVLDEVLHVQYPLGRNNKRIWDVPEVDDIENEHLNVLEIIVSHRVDDHIEDDTLYRTDVDPTIVERPVETCAILTLRLDRYVAANGRIPMTIAPNVEKPIFPYVIRFSQGIGVCVQKTFLVSYLKWRDVGREYIEVVKADLQRFFVHDFSNQAINRFVEHQVLSTFKEFWDDCHRHFKKYTNPEEARANPSNLLVRRDED
ncbi:CACTA en-spm transposon protein [Cucumis melo var. makuwa]|uniref:CACTA en-spm transposon protein n=1 Tax=Cucumis melo var. makuwa TaxID=1194695 RepID=A0A5D3CHQ3_CUCMM|nr:CACTA en-spm transposon protein [Cucumis melo var. makuwa]